MPRCISVHKDLAERAIRELRKKNLIDEGYLIAKVGDRVLIPVLEASHEIELSFGRVQAFECTLQPRNRPHSAVKMPSLDLLGEAVILREKVLMYRSLQEVIDSVRQVYPRVRAIWVKEETADVYRKPVLRL
ncbi:MAG: methyltransferase, partial [Desulfurococcaceae archaeon]